MLRSLFLPLTAVASFTFMAVHLARTNQPIADRTPVIEPSKSPFQKVIAGAGLVEAQSENIAVAAHLPGIVAEVKVKEGDKVTCGDLLFRLDDRQRQAELSVQKSLLATAQADLDRLLQQPRPEDIPPSEAKVRQAKADLVARQDVLSRSERLLAGKVASEEDVIQKRQAVAVAKEVLSGAQAEHARLMAGAWERDLVVARAQLFRAQQGVNQAKIELDRLEVRAPVAGHILKVDVRPGEYVGTPPDETLIVLGNLDRLHVRVDIDEDDLPRFRPGLPGEGFVRGDARTPLKLEFVRVEPYVFPKKSLTGAGNERVDTRALQVLYALPPGLEGIYVGQQLDVFLDSSKVKAPAAPESPQAESHTFATEPVRQRQ